MQVVCLYANVLRVDIATAADYSVYLGDQLWFQSASPLLRIGNKTSTLGPHNLVITHNSTGSDKNGKFAETISNFRSQNSVLQLSTKTYATTPMAVFTVRFPNGANETKGAIGWADPSVSPIVSFPSFPGTAHSVMDDASWLVWNHGQLSATTGGRNVTSSFLLQRFIASPHLVMDRQTNHTIIVSPMDHYQGSLCAPDQQHQSWGCGVGNLVSALPAGFEHRVVLYAGVGLTNTMHGWGQMMQAQHQDEKGQEVHKKGNKKGQRRAGLEEDLVVNHLSYFTDNGAFNNIRVNGLYTTAILAELMAKLEQERVPVRTLQLDDFWYNSSDPFHMLLDRWDTQHVCLSPHAYHSSPPPHAYHSATARTGARRASARTGNGLWPIANSKI
jgi:hypothetical protein